MANPSGLLTQNMSPEQARLLDQQLRDKQFQGQQYGGRTGGFMTAASGAIQGAAKAGQGLSGMLTGKTYTGANEQAAVQRQQTQAKNLESLKEEAKNAIYSTPALGEEAASNLLMAIEKDPTGKRAEQVIKKYGMPDAPQNTADAFIKSVQLGINNGSISAESGIAAIEAEQQQSGSGRDKLEFTSKGAERAAEKDLSAKDKERYNNLLDETNELKRKNIETATITQLLDTIKPTAGAAAQVESLFKNVFGTQDTASVLRARIEALRVAQSIGNLPPGVASDKDIELVLSGTLPSTANPEALKEWFAALNRLNNLAIEESEAQLKYFDDKGSMKGYYTERRDFNRKRAEKQAAERQAELDAIVATRAEKIAKAKAMQQATLEREQRAVSSLKEDKNIETDFFGRF